GETLPMRTRRIVERRPYTGPGMITQERSEAGVESQLGRVKSGGRRRPGQTRALLPQDRRIRMATAASTQGVAEETDEALSALIRIRSGPVNLHFFWDGLLGTGTTAGDIGKAVAEIESVLESRAADIRKELEAYQTFENWAREGEELSRRAVYLN